MANLSSELNNYLKSSGSSLIDQTSSSSSHITSNGNPIRQWFSRKDNQSGWFYQPLSQSGSINSELNTSHSKSSWFSGFIPSRNEEETKGCIPTLSRTQRIIGFIAFFFMGVVCFSLSVMYIPILLFAARKFSLLFTLGSVFVIASFAILLGPVKHLKHQFSYERLPYTSTYFASLISTLYFALHVQSTILTCFSAIIQVIALIWYVLTYVPGGQTGLMFFSKMAANSVTRTLPV